MKRIYLLLLGTLALGLSLSGPATGTPIHIFVGAPGRNRVPIAVPRTLGGGEQLETFEQVLARDLALSGWFEVIPREAYVEPVGTGLATGDFKFEDWDLTGAAALAKTGLESRGKSLRAEVWVYDVAGRRRLGAKAFSAKAEAVRTLAHRVANEIIFQVSGQQGPFNTRFAFSGNFTGNKEIYLVDFDGHGQLPITRNGSINLQPSWDADGLRLAFTSYIAGNPDMYVADLSKGRIRRLSAREGINTGATWHPNQELLALTLSPDGNSDIYTLKPSNGDQIARLTRTMGMDISPAWSPGGEQLAFVSDRSGGAQIYVMNADGSDVRRVTFKGTHNTDPTWSPDGQRLAFVSRDGVFDVFTVRLDGTGLTRITQSAGDNEDPSWSPDGNYLAFSSTRTGSSHIWMSTADGSHQVQLTEGKGGYTNPAWSPSLAW
ncbi:MAG: Tol-Pal system beta propeller repeat protein TolB [Myxococcota bacterium]|nr:Tol-Pal system beta propeller repeat protein TolB [Myxococcota bacterium]